MVDTEESVAEPEDLVERRRDGNIRGNRSDIVTLNALRYGNHIDDFDDETLTDEEARNLAEQLRREG